MERKNAIKYLKIYTLGTALLIISFPLVFTPLFNSIEISPTFEAIINSGFIGIGIAWLVFTLKAIQTIIFIIRSKPSTSPKDEVKTSKKEDSSKMDFIQSPFFLFVGFSIVFLLIIYISNNTSQKTESNKSEVVERESNPREEIIIEQQNDPPNTKLKDASKKTKPKPKSTWFRSINESDDPFTKDYVYSRGMVKNDPSLKPIMKIESDGTNAYKFFLSGLQVNVPNYLNKNRIEQPCGECGIMLAFEIAFNPNDGRIWGASTGLRLSTIEKFKFNDRPYNFGWDEHIEKLSKDEHRIYLTSFTETEGGHIMISNNKLQKTQFHSYKGSFVYQIKNKNKMYIRPVIILPYGRPVRSNFKKIYFDIMEFDLTGSTKALSGYNNYTQQRFNNDDSFKGWTTL